MSAKIEEIAKLAMLIQNVTSTLSMDCDLCLRAQQTTAKSCDGGCTREGEVAGHLNCDAPLSRMQVMEKKAGFVSPR